MARFARMDAMFKFGPLYAFGCDEITWPALLSWMRFLMLAR
jgi:hypothetical protein